MRSSRLALCLVMGITASLGGLDLQSAAATRDVVAAVAVDAQRQMVPAYFRPSGGSVATNPWHRMCTRMKQTANRPSTAIMNPSSGPGTATDAAYTEALGFCHTNHQSVIGYVTSDYTRRSLNAVLADVAMWYRLYPGIDGIFVDEMANDPNGIISPGFMSVKTYYGRIYRAVKLHSTSSTDVVDVVGNPGAASRTAWQIDAPVADRVVVFEGRASSYAAWTPPSWVASGPSAKIVQLVHATPNTQRQQVCASSRARNAGFYYVTDDVLANPWDRLPTYWDSVAPKCT